jgi:hypothetical protein
MIKGGLKMKAEEYSQLIQDILSNLQDQGKVSDLLATLTTDYTETLTSINNLTTEKETLTKHNESLKNVNNKIMLQLGNLGTGGTPEPTPKSQETELKYESLFNEKGELK